MDGTLLLQLGIPAITFLCVILGLLQDNCTIYVVHFNRDYVEWTCVKNTHEEALAEIAQHFHVKYDVNSRFFWADVSASYELNDWKGLSLSAVCMRTGQVRELSFPAKVS